NFILKEATVDRYELTQKTARVHFIPNLKVGVFVTLRTPDVIKPEDGKNPKSGWEMLFRVPLIRLA
ncbi:MAG: hypothetical protein WA137_08170, partial [Methanothrix sp.]